MKKTLVSIALLCCALSATFAQSWGTAAPAVSTHTQDETLRIGKAQYCTVVGSRATTIAATNTTQAYGTVLGSTAGVALLAKNTNNASAKIFAAGIGAGTGLKVAQKLGSTDGSVIYVHCGTAGDLITVTQDGPSNVVKGQTVILEQSAGRYRIVSL